jgi:hypothetical protein
MAVTSEMEAFSPGFRPGPAAREAQEAQEQPRRVRWETNPAGNG